MVIHDAGLQFRFPAGKRAVTKDIILHHAAGGGSVEAIHRYHRDTNGWDGIGYHYYVRKDGSVWRGRPEDTIGAHTVGHNYSSIGVCFEGNYEVETMPAAQLAAGRELIADILSRYPGAEVSGHRDNDTTACPGKNFPEELINYKEELMSAKEFIASLTDAEAYEIVTKAQRHAATLPAPNWATAELAAAVEAGVTDGKNPMQFVPRYQAALMAARSK